MPKKAAKKAKRPAKTPPSQQVKKQKPERKPTTSSEQGTLQEIVLYLAVRNVQNPTYANIQTFCAAFGGKGEETVNLLLRKIREGDLTFPMPADPLLAHLYKKMIGQPKLSYPLTLTLHEAWNWLQERGVKTLAEVAAIFQNLAQQYPGFVALSPSKPGEIEDLITFQRLFLDDIKFAPAGRWKL